MRVLFFTDGPESPGSRFRCLQFFPYLEARGIRCEARFAYDARYNDVFERTWAPAYKLAGRLRRVGHLLTARGADVIVVHKTALPVSGLPEHLRARRSTPLVFDYDDAIYLGPGGVEQPLRARAFDDVAAVASHLIAGNAHLAARGRRPDATTIIPTVVDTNRCMPAPRRENSQLVIGWMGTASNFPSLRHVLPSLLNTLATVPRARLRIVSNGELHEYARHPLVEHWRWSEQGELRALQSFDVGLMPLIDSESTRGKCGFKMLQYMAVGVPVLASAVGANVSLFSGSDAGLLVSPHEDWGDKLRELLTLREQFPTLGANGRAHVTARYSVDAVVGTYVRIFESLASATR